MGENILKHVHSFVSTFSVELFLSELFLVGQGFTRAIPHRALLTYTSLVLSACCFLVVITSDILRSHRKCGVVCGFCPISTHPQYVSGESYSAIWKWLCLQKSYCDNTRFIFLPCPCCLEWKRELYFDNCQEDRIANKCRRWNLSYLECIRSFVIGLII